MIDARETAPGAASENMFNSMANASEFGFLGIAIPGDLHGLWTAFKNFGSGKISWADLFQPTIDLCLKGYRISAALGNAIKNAEKFIRDPKNFME